MGWALPSGPGFFGLRYRSVCQRADRFAPCASLTRRSTADYDRRTTTRHVIANPERAQTDDRRPLVGSPHPITASRSAVPQAGRLLLGLSAKAPP